MFVDKLELLFETVHPPDRGPYSSDELAEALHADGIPFASRVVERLRAGIGGPPSRSVIAAIGKFFAVDPDDLAEAEGWSISYEPHHVPSEQSLDPTAEKTDPDADHHLDRGVKKPGDLDLSVQEVGALLEGISECAALRLRNQEADLAIAARISSQVADVGSRLASCTSGRVVVRRETFEQIVVAWAATRPYDTEWRAAYLSAAEILAR